MALKIVELIPSATSNSPFSLGRVKLLSLPDPNILKRTKLTGDYTPASNLGLRKVLEVPTVRNTEILVISEL